MDDKENNEDIIVRAIMALQNNVKMVLLSNNEKNALIKVLEKMLIYYETKKALILKKGGDNCNERIIVLQCFMTDLLVKVNNALVDETDVHYVVSLVNIELSDKNFKKILCRNKW